MPSYTQQVDQRMQELTKPLRDELRTIEKRLEEIDLEAQELRASRRRIGGVLRQLDPRSFVAKPKNPARVGPTHVGSNETKEQKRQAVTGFIEGHRKNYADGIVAAEVYRDMKEAKIEPISSPSVILEIIREMHSNGVLRADKKVRGGAMSYMYIGGGDGKA